LSRKETRTLQHVKRVKIEKSNEREDQRGVKGASAAAASVQHALEVPVSVAVVDAKRGIHHREDRGGVKEVSTCAACIAYALEVPGSVAVVGVPSVSRCKVDSCPEA
jgi:hypothetical protein